MIIGIGHDIVENERIHDLYLKYGDLFLKKVLSPEEISIFKQQQKSINYIAKRFAAKEAFAKACGTGIRAPILFPAITVMNNELGKPIFKFNEQIDTWLTTHTINSVHISLSDENKLSSAFVILEV